MKAHGVVAIMALVALPSALAASATDNSNPMGKVVELMDSLAAKITKDGEDEAKAFAEYFEWCDDESKNLQNEIKSLTTKKEKLEATIAKAASVIEESTTDIASLAASIAKAEAERRDATAIREKEHSDFVAAEEELVGAVDMLGRAIAIISKEMGSALMQVDTTNLKRLVQSMGAIIDAAGFSGTDKQKLVALVQSRQGDSDYSEADEAALGAPAAAVYTSHSSGIVDVLEDMKDKAEEELTDARKAETNAQHNFEMLAQSLTDAIAADNHDMGEAKDNKSEAEEAKATAEGDLAMTVKGLAATTEALATCQKDCMGVASDHEATCTGRAEELSVIAEAKKILLSSSPGAVGQTYSLLQVAAGTRMRTRTDLANAEIVGVVRKLARQYHSAALAQLESRITAVLRMGSTDGGDPFVKVRGLISDMINKLEAEAAEEATEKAYCDEQMAKTEAKKSDLEDTVAKLTAKIDAASATSAQRKSEVKELQAELAALAKKQAEMDKTRADQHAAYTEAKADLELGLSGVKKAIQVLREYYGSAALLQDQSKFAAFMQQPPKPEKFEKAGGAGGSIIGILEVCESDFAKNLAEEEEEESDAQATYDQVTQENKVMRTQKEQDVKYKTLEATKLDKAIGELSGDRDSSNEELSSVNEYYAKVKDRCIAQPETYEERKRRREAEIAGLKEALSVLESETVLVQQGAHSRTLRR